jgi:hypothetical protein
MENKWLCDEFNISYPHDWQRPAKTEEWTWEYLNSSPHRSKFIEFISFPWATLIDLLGRKQDSHANILIFDLNKIPPKKKLIRATVCQHVNVKEIIHLLKKIKITDIFWSHKVKNQNYIDGIRIHPYVLYPYAYFEKSKNLSIENVDADYIFSFIGAYDEGCYLSNARKRIFEFNKMENSLIIRRENWHFEHEVYKLQINKVDIKSEEINTKQKFLNEYIDSLTKTVFILCPSGSGANTIRYWEAIAFGRVPILLSDTWDQPEINIIYSGLSVLEENLEEFLFEIQSQEKIKILKSYENIIFNCKKNKEIHPSKWLEIIFDKFYSNQNIINIVKS